MKDQSNILFRDYIIEKQINFTKDHILYDFVLDMKDRYKGSDEEVNHKIKIYGRRSHTVGGFQMRGLNKRNILDYTENDGIKPDHVKALTEFKESVVFPNIDEYIKLSETEVNEDEFLEYNSWFVYYDKSAYQKLHTHVQTSIFTMIYYLKTPVNIKDNEGDLVILDTKSTFRGTRERKITPLPGKLVIFPAYYPHGTLPFFSDEERICIVTDCHIKDKRNASHNI